MKRKLRVLHVVEGFCGGVFGALQGMVNGAGDDVEIVILHAMRDATPQNYKKIFKPGTIFIESKYLTREISPIQDYKACRELSRIVKKVQPDVVHLHSSKAGAIGRLALNGKKIPIFYSPQGYSFLMYQCSAAKRKMYYMLERMLGKRTSITVASCKGEFESAKKVSNRATYIDNGIDPEELDCFELDIEKRSTNLTVCTLGRVVGQKNPGLFNRIAERFPHIRFIWIGGGELENELTSSNIEITGWLPKDKALEIMMDASVFLLTSFYEGLAFSIMEAMYLKRLCVVSKIPGNVDAIEDGKTGYLCETFDDYVSVFEKLQHSGINESMLCAAREHIVHELNQNVMAHKYLKLYQQEIEAIAKK